jgi:hypothetical protein
MQIEVAFPLGGTGRSSQNKTLWFYFIRLLLVLISHKVDGSGAVTLTPKTHYYPV